MYTINNYESKKRVFDQGETFNCDLLMHSISRDNTRGNVSYFLNDSYSYSSWHLDKLNEIRAGIESKYLGKFLDLIFSDKAIAIPFLQVPASTKHHHAIKSGLLIHSVETAMIASQLHYENTANRDITIVAALLHDIGKIKSYTTDLKTTILGKLVCHDHLTLEICAEALKVLDIDWPDAANTLRHIWTCASPGSRYGFQPCTPLGNIVRFADKFSVDNYDLKNAFDNKLSKTGFAWSDKDKKYFWNASNAPLGNERRKICF